MSRRLSVGLSCLLMDRTNGVAWRLRKCAWVLWKLPEWSIVIAPNAYLSSTTLNLVEYAGMNRGTQASIDHKAPTWLLRNPLRSQSSNLWGWLRVNRMRCKQNWCTKKNWLTNIIPPDIYMSYAATTQQHTPCWKNGGCEEDTSSSCVKYWIKRKTKLRYTGMYQ